MIWSAVALNCSRAALWKVLSEDKYWGKAGFALRCCRSDWQLLSELTGSELRC